MQQLLKQFEARRNFFAKLQLSFQSDAASLRKLQKMRKQRTRFWDAKLVIQQELVDDQELTAGPQQFPGARQQRERIEILCGLLQHHDVEALCTLPLAEFGTVKLHVIRRVSATHRCHMAQLLGRVGEG